MLALVAGILQMTPAASAASRTALAEFATASEEPTTFDPGAFTPEEETWDQTTGVTDTGDPRLRGLVADIADLSEDFEVRDAASAALQTGTAEAVMVFLTTGEPAAQAAAAARKKQAAKTNKDTIARLAGTGGSYFNAEVQRVLKGTDQDRILFLAYGADVARARDAAATQDIKIRTDQLRARAQMVAGLPDSHVSRAAQAALASGDSAIATFFQTGFVQAAKLDAAQREKELADQRARDEAAEKLSELAVNAARAATARKNLMTAHGNGVHALQEAANALTSVAIETRRAEQILAANTVSGNHPATAYDQVIAEAARQAGYAQEAARRAQQASAQATVEAGILVETGLPYGSEWAVISQGMAEAAQAAVLAAETARQTIAATAATGAARNAEQNAIARAAQAQKWREYSQEHAKAATRLAATAKKQADIAKAAAARTKALRLEAETAEKKAWDAARRTREARVRAEEEAAKAEAARKVAEQERAAAAAARARAEQQAAIARQQRGQAEYLAGVAAAGQSRAEEADRKATTARNNAVAADNKATTARNNAVAAEQESRTADAKAAKIEAWAQHASSGQYSGEATRAALEARGEADTARSAATGARAAANTATGAAANARAAAVEAERAAARARAAAAEARAAAARADAAATKAEQQAAETHEQTLKALKAAAEATEQQVVAAEASRAASAAAVQAAAEASMALRGAERTKSEAEAAAREAVTALEQATTAVEAADAAGLTASGIAQPANTAIALVRPFTGADIAADFTVEVADRATKLGEEFVDAADRRADEAVNAAKSAQAAAERAAAEVKPAYEAAASAAASAAAASKSAAEAIKSAQAAAVDGAAARDAGISAAKADAQAAADAMLARQAANNAAQDAAIAGMNASAAANDAGAARNAAARAESDAAAARAAASRAETAATAAEKAADHAETSAKEAAAAALHALQMAKEAQAAFERAEAKDREAERKAREKAVDRTGSGDNSMDPADAEILCGGEPDFDECVRSYQEDLNAAAEGVTDFLKEHGVEMLEEILLGDIKRCFKEGDVEACIWTVIGLIPWTKVGPVIKAFTKVAPKVGKWLDRINNARKRLDEATEAITECLNLIADIGDVVSLKRTTAAGFGKVSASVMAAGGGKKVKCPDPPKAVTRDAKRIREGTGGTPNRDNNDVHIIWEGEWVDNPYTHRRDPVSDKVKSKWGGSLEYKVPESPEPGKTRILVKLDSNGEILRIGWTVNHYWTIYSIYEKPEE